MSESITIISLGWLGCALYKDLQSCGLSVSGAYHNSPKKFDSEYKFDINNDLDHKYIQECKTIIFNLPPSVIESDDNLFSFLERNKMKKILFISSTSIYGKQGHVNEKTIPMPESKNGKRLLATEKFIKKNVKSYKIIRSAGQIEIGRAHV